MKDRALRAFAFSMVLLALPVSCSSEVRIGTPPPELSGMPSMSPSSGLAAESPVSWTSEPIPSQTPFPFAEVAYSGARLYLQPFEDNLCISIIPTCYKPWPRYYYVPGKEEQKRLRELQRAYQEDGSYSVLVIDNRYVKRDTELFEYAYSLVHRDCGITLMDSKEIRDLVKAKLYYTGADTNTTQTITDKNKLGLIEQRLSDASETNSTKCPFHEGLLVLTRKDGKTIMLRLASDGDSIYVHDGQYFRYKGPATDILFLFDKIEWAAYRD